MLRGFTAFDTFLQQHPEFRERVTFIAHLQPSRQDVPEYAEYLERIEALVAVVNHRHGTTDWMPIDLRIYENFPEAVARYKHFDLLMVNALFDGMNLVAKEAPAVNTRDGVVLLSENTGAHEELGDCTLTVNPFDIQEQADAIHRALTMSADERAAPRRAAARDRPRPRPRRLDRRAARRHPPQAPGLGTLEAELLDGGWARRARALVTAAGSGVVSGAGVGDDTGVGGGGEGGAVGGAGAGLGAPPHRRSSANCVHLPSRERGLIGLSSGRRAALRAAVLPRLPPHDGARRGVGAARRVGLASRAVRRNRPVRPRRAGDQPDVVGHRRRLRRAQERRRERRRAQPRRRPRRRGVRRSASGSGYGPFTRLQARRAAARPGFGGPGTPRPDAIVTRRHEHA